MKKWSLQVQKVNLLTITFGFLLTSSFAASIARCAVNGDNEKAQPAVDLSGIQLIVTPNPEGHTEFIEQVQKAKSKINLAMFRLTDDEDVQALSDAAKRNVQVKVIIDRSSAEVSNKEKQIQQTLTNAGVQIKESSKGFSITHEKSMTIDDSTILISSLNLTTAYKITRDFGVIFHDAGLINEFNSVFEVDWVNADQGTTTTPTLQSASLVWSPNNSTDRLTSVISTAKSTIELYVENFTDKTISDALVTAATNGVRVRIITPLCTENPANPLLNLPQLQILSQKNILAKVMPEKKTPETPYIHAKAIVIDGNSFYLGSENFSYNSLTKAREVGVILNDRLVASQIQTVFNQDWAQAQNLPSDNNPSLCSSLAASEALKTVKASK